MIPGTPRAYTINEAKMHLSALLAQVERGADVVIVRAGVPIARLIPVARVGTHRILGTEAGRLLIPDDFDAPLPSTLATHVDADRPGRVAD